MFVVKPNFKALNCFFIFTYGKLNFEGVPPFWGAFKKVIGPREY